MKAFGICIMGDEGFWFSGVRVFDLISADGIEYIKAEVQEPPTYATKGVRICPAIE